MEIVATSLFIKCAKPLAKRYRSFNNDYKEFLKSLDDNPHGGVDLGNGFYKIRMAIKSKGKGKSGGARVITFDAIERNNTIYLLYAYDKSDQESVHLSILKHYARELGLID